MDITINKIIEALNCRRVTGSLSNSAVRDVYIGDLLSWVMGNAPEKCAWVTIQGHVNIIAVALLVGASCIIIAENAEISPETITRANDAEIPVLSTPKTAFEIAGILTSLNK